MSFFFFFFFNFFFVFVYNHQNSRIKASSFENMACRTANRLLFLTKFSGGLGRLGILSRILRNHSIT